MATLRSRLDRLEAKRSGDILGPLVFLFRVRTARCDAKVTGAARHTPESRFAIIGAGQHGNAVTLRIGEDEGEAAFLARLQAEVIRIHGQLPTDWSPA